MVAIEGTGLNESVMTGTSVSLLHVRHYRLGQT